MNGDDVLDWLTTDGLRIAGVLVAVLAVNVALRRGAPALVRALMRLRVAAHPENAAQRAETVARVVYVTGWIVSWIVAALTILPMLGLETAPLLTAAGLGGIALAFGAQKLVRDVLNGIFILIEDQYAIGDVVRIAGVSGTVEDISLRRTVLRDLDGSVHHIPNGEIATVTNLGVGWSRVNVDVPLPYGADLERAIAVIDRVGQELAADPAFRERVTSPPRFLRVDSFTDAGMVLKVMGDTKRLEQWAVAGELRRRLQIAFVHEGITPVLSGAEGPAGAPGPVAPSGPAAAEPGEPEAG